MSHSTVSTAEALQRDFDASFALPVTAQPLADTALLAIRVGGHPYALRASQLDDVQLMGRILPIPCRLPEMIGLVMHSGAMVPVYALTLLLGHGRSGADSRWLVSCSSTSALALAFEEFEGQVLVPEAEVYRAEDGESVGEFVHEAVRTETGVRAIVDTALVVKAVERRVSQLERRGVSG